jgi:serine protease inhibitor
MRPLIARTTAVSSLFALVLSCSSCAATGAGNQSRSGGDRPTGERGGPPGPARTSPYVTFGFDLYHELLVERAGENIFISPASVGLALAMTYNGARGETMLDMAKVLGFGERTLAETNRSDSALIAAMNALRDGIELSIANALWARAGLHFNAEFLARDKRYYGAEVRSIDFTSAEAPATINGWVAEKTKNRIPEIVGRIDESTILFLINAIYFKGTWTREFDAKETREQPFYATGGEKTVPMMRQSASYLYLRGDGFQVAAIPYGDGRMSMYVFLPDERTGLDEFNAKLSGERWESWMSLLATRKGFIALPRFKLEFKAELKRALTALGMGIAFEGDRADFGGMIEQTGQNAYMSDVVHKTFVEVNEKGTEAAAATSVEMRFTSVMEPETPFEMVCDHPFFVAIRDNETGLILFMGSIVDPR